MAQKKKQKNSKPTRASFKKGTQNFEAITDSGKRRGVFCDRLLMRDERKLREITDQQDETRQRILYAYLLQDTIVDVVTQKTVENYVEFSAKQSPRFFQAYFAQSVISLMNQFAFGYLASDDAKMEDYQELMEDILKSIPKGFRRSGTPENPFAFRFSDPLETVIYSCVDWSAVFRGKDATAWARSCARILKSTIEDFDSDDLETKRDHLIEALATDVNNFLDGFIEKELGIFKNVATEMGATDVLQKIPQPSKRIRADVSPFRSMSFPNIDAIKPSIDTSGQVQAAKEEKDWLVRDSAAILAHGALRILGDPEASDRVFEQTFRRLDTGVLPYAAITLLANCANEYLVPTVVQNIIFQSTSASFPGRMYQDAFLPELNNRYATIRMDEELPLTARYEKQVLDARAKADVNVKCQMFVTPQQIAYMTNCVILPNELSIPLDLARPLENLGLKQTQAIALCGYLEGARAGALSTMLASDKNQLPTVRDEDEPTPEDFKAQFREEAQNEVADKLAEAQKTLERGTVIANQAKKAVRAAEHKAERALAEKEQVSEELTECHAEIRRLKAEREELRKAVFELTEQLGTMTDEPEPDLKEQFPYHTDCKIVIVGGPQKWTSEQARRFPDIDIYDVENRPEEAVVAGADIVMVNTFVLKHKVFDMVQDVTNKAGKPMHYFLNRGINRGSMQIIDTYQTYMRENERPAGKVESN